MPNQQNKLEDIVLSTDASLSSYERERREGILRNIITHVQQEGEHIAQAHPDRARQFMPFAALKGYHELAYEQERIPEPKHSMTEERAAELSRTISSLSKGHMVSVVHYENGYYTTSCGVVTEVDETFRTIRIVKKNIPFDDILSIEVRG